MFLPSHSPSYRAETDYTRKAIIPQRGLQIQQIPKENIISNAYLQTTKKPAFESQMQPQNISPIRHVQFKVSGPLQTRTPPQQRVITNHPSYTPTKLVPVTMNHSPRPLLTSQKYQQYKAPQQTQLSQTLNLPQQQKIPQTQQKEQQQPSFQGSPQVKQFVQQSYQPSQHQTRVSHHRPSEVFETNESVPHNVSIYNCLQEELIKSELKLQQLFEKSKNLQEQRKKLQENYRQKTSRSPRKY